MKRKLWLLALVCVTPIASAGVYRWVDAQGQVHYSAQPSVAGSQVQQMQMQKSPPPDPHSAERLKRMQEYLNKDERDDGKADEDQMAKEQADQKRRESMCAAARERLKVLAYGRVYRLNDNGERAFLTDSQLEKAKAQAQAAEEEWCG